MILCRTRKRLGLFWTLYFVPLSCMLAFRAVLLCRNSDKKAEKLLPVCKLTVQKVSSSHQSHQGCLCGRRFIVIPAAKGCAGGM